MYLQVITNNKRKEYYEEYNKRIAKENQIIYFASNFIPKNPTMTLL